MPGATQSLFIPLAAGISTDIDDHLLVAGPAGKALDVVNMGAYETGNLRKRFGYGLRTSQYQAAGGTIPPVWQLANCSGADAALSASGSPLEIYSPTENAWSPATSSGRAGPLLVSLTKASTQSFRAPFVTVGGGFIFVVYGDTTSPSLLIHFDVIDATTLKLVVGKTFTIAGPAFSLDVIYVNGFAVLVTNESGVGIVFRVLTPATLAVTTNVYVAPTASGSGLSVIQKDATTIGVIWGSGAGFAEGVDFVPSTLGRTGWSPRDAAGVAIPSATLPAVWMNDLGASGKLAIVSTDSVLGVRAHWNIPTAGATRQAVTTYVIDAGIGAATVVSASAHTISADATGAFAVLYVLAGVGGITNNTTRQGLRTGGVLTLFTLYRSLSLLSKSWQFGTEFYALFTFPSKTDGNSYVMRIPTVTGQPVPVTHAIFAVGSSGNMTPLGQQNSDLASVNSTGFGSFVTAISYINRIGTQADTVSPPATSIGVELVTIKHLSGALATPTTGAPIVAVNGLIVPGGAIGHFDGQTYGELGFAYNPQPAVTLTPAVGGAMTPAVTYWYSFVFSRMDATGRLWRSAPSVAQSVAMGATGTQVTIAVPTDRVTSYSNVTTEIYRGAANDAVSLIKVGQVTNNYTVDSVAYVDTVSDAALAIGEPLYTTGDILPNETIPGSPFIFVFQNRLCFISADDPTELWFSNIISPKNGPRFNSQNVVRIADSHGPTYAAGVMDDKIVALKSDAIYSWNGDGPDDAGNGGYSPAVIVALGVGTTKPRSVLSLPDGVIFDSSAGRPGLQMIDRALNLAKAAGGAPFGEAVLRYTGETIMSAILIAEQSQARFYCFSGVVLVYDLVTATWTTSLLGYTNIVSAINTGNGALVAANAGDTLLIEDTTGATYADNGTMYDVRVGTPWIQIDGVKGFQRLIQLIGAGRTIAAHTLTVDMYLDGDDTTIVQTKTFAMVPGTAGKWDWEWNRPRVARMSAVRFVVTETSAAAGFQCNGIAALLKTRTALARQSTATRGL